MTDLKRLTTVLVTTLIIGLPSAAAPAPTPPAPRRCDVIIHQPAASVQLNRREAPPSVCVRGCDAKLVGVRREEGRIAALAIYTGRRCRPAATTAPKPARRLP